MIKTSMVVAAQPDAAEIGIETLRAGGNAVDAAIATAIAQGVCDPMMCGVSGYGTMVIHLHGQGEQVCVDFHSRAPGAVTPTMWEHLLEFQSPDGFGFNLTGNINELGYKAIGVPAAVRGYELAHARYGRMPWSEVIQPSIDLARRGWAICPTVYRYWNEPAAKEGLLEVITRLGFSEEGRRLYFRPNGATKQIGETIVNENLAVVLETIARDGADSFYIGDIAKAMIADIAANEGLLTLDDLATYTARVSTPARGRYRGFDVVSSPSPASGVMLAQMLMALESYDLVGLGHNTPDYIRLVSEVMKRSTVDKEALIGDPALLPDPAAVMLDPTRLALWREQIDRGEKQKITRAGKVHEPSDTTTLAVVDADSNCVALTQTLALPSGVVSNGLGFIHNGTMAAFDPRPGYPGSMTPGRVRISSMCPSVVLQDGQPRIVLGAPGGPQIPMGVLQTILNILDFGMPVDTAVAAPRFSATSNTIDLSRRIPHSTALKLSEQGYASQHNPYAYAFSAVHALELTRVGGVTGGADPGRDGVAYGF
ncbi:MAG: gamma-glutamyltransferase [Rhizobiaceae bacterium]